MPTMTDVRTHVANTTIPNILSGKTNEFLASDSIVRVGAVATVAGLFMTLIIGDVVVVNDQEVGINSTPGGLPKDPDEIIVDDVGRAGDRLVLSLRNTAGTPTSTVMVKTTPV